MAFDDSGGLDQRPRYLAEEIATQLRFGEKVDPVFKMDSAFLDEDGNPNWDNTDAVQVLEILDELLDENPFVLADFQEYEKPPAR